MSLYQAVNIIVGGTPVFDDTWNCCNASSKADRTIVSLVFSSSKLNHQIDIAQSPSESPQTQFRAMWRYLEEPTLPRTEAHELVLRRAHMCALLLGLITIKGKGKSLLLC